LDYRNNLYSVYRVPKRISEIKSIVLTSLWIGPILLFLASFISHIGSYQSSRHGLYILLMLFLMFVALLVNALIFFVIPYFLPMSIILGLSAFAGTKLALRLGLPKQLNWALSGVAAGAMGLLCWGWISVAMGTFAVGTVVANASFAVISAVTGMLILWLAQRRVALLQHKTDPTKALPVRKQWPITVSLFVVAAVSLLGGLLAA